MNDKQKKTLELFLAGVATRGLSTANETELENGKAVVVLTEAPDFPTVVIGKQGGVDMPTIKSYPQDGVATALDACIWGDWHQKRQAAGRKAKGEAYPYAVSQKTKDAVAAAA